MRIQGEHLYKPLRKSVAFWRMGLGWETPFLWSPPGEGPSMTACGGKEERTHIFILAATAVQGSSCHVVAPIITGNISECLPGVRHFYKLFLHRSWCCPAHNSVPRPQDQPAAKGRASPALDAASPAARSAVPAGVGRGLLNKGGDGPEV